MSGRMPILRQHDVLVVGDQAIDPRDDGIGAGYRQRAAVAEIVLHVDDDQGLVGHGAMSPNACSASKAAIQDSSDRLSIAPRRPRMMS